jgi:hypothetical protein
MSKFVEHKAMLFKKCPGHSQEFDTAAWASTFQTYPADILKAGDFQHLLGTLDKITGNIPAITGYDFCLAAKHVASITADNIGSNPRSRQPA